MSAQDPHEEEALGKIYDSRLARRLLTYLKPYKGRVIAALILTVLSGVFVLAQPLLVLRLLDHAIPNRDEQQIAWICVAFMALMILEYISQYTYILLVNATGQKAMYDLRVELFQHLQRQIVHGGDPVIGEHRLRGERVGQLARLGGRGAGRGFAAASSHGVSSGCPPGALWFSSGQGARRHRLA